MLRWNHIEERNLYTLAISPSEAKKQGAYMSLKKERIKWA